MSKGWSVLDLSNGGFIFPKIDTLPDVGITGQVYYTDKLYIFDDQWNTLSSSFIILDRTQVLDKINTNELIPNSFYKITGVDTDLYGGTDIVLQAVSNNLLNPSGIGFFWNPRYNQGIDGFNIYTNHISYNTINGSITGTFQGFENIYGDNGAVGMVPYGCSPEGGIISPVSGSWAGITAITGESSGALAYIEYLEIPSISINDKKIWGGKVWSNKTGNIGSSIDEYTLDSTDWDLVSPNTTDYDYVADIIKYDIVNDLILYREEKTSNNIVKFSKYDLDIIYDNYGSPHYHPIRCFQWGNIKDFMGDNAGRNNIIVDGGINFNINLRSRVQSNINIKNGYMTEIIGNTNVYIENILLENSYMNNIVIGNTSAINSIELYNNSSLNRLTVSSYFGNNKLFFSYINGLVLRNGSEFSYNILKEYSYFSDLIIDVDSRFTYNLINENTGLEWDNYLTTNNKSCTLVEYGKDYIYYNFFYNTNSSLPIGDITYNQRILYIPYHFFIKEITFDSSNLIAPIDSYINIGIETDGETSGINNTNGNLSDLITNGVTTIIPNIYVKSQTVRKLIMRIVGAATTSGTFGVSIELKKIM